MSAAQHCDAIIDLIDRCLEEYEREIQALLEACRPRPLPTSGRRAARV